MGNAAHWSTRTSHTHLEPIESPYDLHSACGMISPKSSTIDTDTSTAPTSPSSLSRKMGSASIATAFHTSRVTSTRCWFRRMGMTRWASRFCDAVPDRIRISRSSRSMPIRPSVRPLMSPCGAPPRAPAARGGVRPRSCHRPVTSPPPEALGPAGARGAGWRPGPGTWHFLGREPAGGPPRRPAAPRQPPPSPPGGLAANAPLPRRGAGAGRGGPRTAKRTRPAEVTT